MSHIGGFEPVTSAEVHSVRSLAEGVVSVTLGALSGHLPKWEPGAHVDLVMAPGLVRQYSLCGSPDDDVRWRIAVLLEQTGRGGSAFVHNNLAAGDLVEIRGPRNHFALVEAERYLFVAGGIGITPILPMLHSVTQQGLPWQLLYGGRRRASMAFLDELLDFGERVTVAPQDEVGLLDLKGFIGDRGAPGTAVYCCGPGPLLDAIEREAQGWPGAVLHLERFARKEGALDGLASSFDVVLSSTGASIRVGPDESIVEALEEAGIDVDTSCREGTCGTCETVVLEGVPDHRDSVLTSSEKAANDVMMICCSRSMSDRLVLDL